MCWTMCWTMYWTWTCSTLNREIFLVPATRRKGKSSAAAWRARSSVRQLTLVRRKEVRHGDAEDDGERHGEKSSHPTPKPAREGNPQPGRERSEREPAAQHGPRDELAFEGPQRDECRRRRERVAERGE